MIATSFAVVNGSRDRFKNLSRRALTVRRKGCKLFGSEEFALTVCYNPKIARR
ncbi:hypothetical protein [Fervidibacter sacchari]